MTTLTATAVPAIAAVLLRVTAAPAGPLVITRTDINGTRPVRLLPGQEPIAGVLTVYDYEAALTGPVLYESDGQSATITDLAPGTLVVSSALLPGIRHTPVMLLDISEDTEGLSVFHDVIDRADPVVVLGPAQTARGRATFLEATYGDAENARKVLDSGHLIHLRQPTYPGLDRYFVTTRTTSRPVAQELEPRPWLVDVEFRVVPMLDAPLAGAAGWDFAALTASASTFTAAATPFPTFADMTVGP